MFDGFTFDKLLIVSVIAAFLIGPSRLPRLAEQAASLIRRLRDLSDGAKSRMREELGDELADIEWKRLDPRQYDPRRIIMDALSAPQEAPEPNPIATAIHTTSSMTDDQDK